MTSDEPLGAADGVRAAIMAFVTGADVTIENIRRRLAPPFQMPGYDCGRSQR
jgi:hypothetical protein